MLAGWLAKAKPVDTVVADVQSVEGCISSEDSRFAGTGAVLGRRRSAWVCGENRG